MTRFALAGLRVRLLLLVVLAIVPALGLSLHTAAAERRIHTSIADLRPALDIPYGHHERWDGTGYPRGLRGEAIPLAARIFAVIDVWDALRSDRPYRAAWPDEKVRDHICSLSGRHFDPQVVQVFLELEA